MNNFRGGSQSPHDAIRLSTQTSILTTHLYQKHIPLHTYHLPCVNSLIEIEIAIIRCEFRYFCHFHEMVIHSFSTFVLSTLLTVNMATTDIIIIIIIASCLFKRRMYCIHLGKNVYS